ncbi:MAG TPA: DUF4145 domain-containing protein [Thermodesulfovibrionales bacterium]|nr:DUF4145 domain-containing protein [Thermodesulfovibrionales bacterium]
MAVVDLQRIGTIGHELIHLCHFCESPTYFDENGKQFPGSPYGDAVKGIPVKEVEAIYNEARNCISVNAYTGAVLCCRKLLMNISVSKGAKQGLSFIEYVEFLAANSYIPPDAKDWVDHIRKKGNEANHEITIMNREDAEELVSFAEMLLKVIYEFPAAIKNKTTAKKAS